MFGISLTELAIATLLTIFLVKPSDLPQIASFFGKIYSKFKKITNLAKENIELAKKEVGFDEIKQEFNIAVEDEKKDTKAGEKTSQIVDIYGKTHHVMDISELRSDLSKEDIESEIDALNKQNKKDASTVDKDVENKHE